METIPLDRLMLSRLNVRRTERDADVAALAEDIAARGLKQNLVVIPAHFVSGEAEADWEGKFEVIAGGRRFQAMQLLVADGRLHAAHPVNCLVEDREQASETSLSENLHRVAMNPADEFTAFATIVANYRREAPTEPAERAEEFCAKRFGVSASHVRGRLRLASLAPEILEALRRNAITLDAAKAYAGSEDHELQLKVFLDQCKPNVWKPHDPQTVRSGLRGETVGLAEGRVKFVGLDAYRAAGGRTEVEMFMGTDGDERLLDVKLLDKLAKEQAEPMVGPMAKADGFKSGLLAAGLGNHARLPKLPEGMERHNSWEATPTKAQLKKCVGIYAIAWEGTGIEKIAHFRPIQVRKEIDTRDWEAERREREREWAIERRAAQTALSAVLDVGTPPADDIVWPRYNTRPIEEDSEFEEHVLVSVQIRVSMADIEARRAEAERAIDAEAAEREAADAAALDPELKAEEADA